MAAEELAKQGAPDAARTIFLAVYVRVNQPILGGEGDMTMVMIVQQVLAAIGDRRFSAALAKQRAAVRALLRRFAASRNHS